MTDDLRIMPELDPEPTRRWVENRSAVLHCIYQEEARRQGDVRHAERYEELSENIKEFDRVLARFEHAIQRESFRAGMERAAKAMCIHCENRRADKLYHHSDDSEATGWVERCCAKKIWMVLTAHDAAIKEREMKLPSSTTGDHCVGENRD